jgi:hypothetical protein
LVAYLGIFLDFAHDLASRERNGNRPLAKKFGWRAATAGRFKSGGAYMVGLHAGRTGERGDQARSCGLAEGPNQHIELSDIAFGLAHRARRDSVIRGIAFLHLRLPVPAVRISRPTAPNAK